MKKVLLITGTILVIIGIILMYLYHPKIIKIKNIDDTKFENAKFNDNITYSYTITRNKKQYKNITNKSRAFHNYKKYNYMVIEIDRGASCNADIDIVNVSEKKTFINVDIKLSNHSISCSVSTPKYFVIPISKKYKSNVDVKLNEVGD